ncbi:ribosomal RNA small subunit methyltransferase A [Candidatus Pacearchaeota archaeon]|nr:MAG: ribosomal RNA small subunit methyltransferase A [Candidatus Pacearchaeota archaeon]
MENKKRKFIRDGKHFLVDEKILEKMCDYAEVKKGDKILEIGAGTGNLTEKLLSRGAFVYAIEKDPSLVLKLKNRFLYTNKKKNLVIIKGDALKLKFPKFDKVVSSLPFLISRKITEKLIATDFNLGILVYQKEFVRKLIAKKKSKNYRFISALVQSYCSKIEILENISPTSFEPSPNVVSTIVKIVQKKEKKELNEDYINFLRILFNHKNKKIRNVIPYCKSISINLIPEKFKNKRVFELSPDELIEIYSNF